MNTPAQAVQLHFAEQDNVFEIYVQCYNRSRFLTSATCHDETNNTSTNEKKIISYFKM